MTPRGEASTTPTAHSSPERSESPPVAHPRLCCDSPVLILASLVVTTLLSTRPASGAGQAPSEQKQGVAPGTTVAGQRGRGKRSASKPGQPRGPWPMKLSLSVRIAEHESRKDQAAGPVQPWRASSYPKTRAAVPIAAQSQAHFASASGEAQTAVAAGDIPSCWTNSCSGSRRRSGRSTGCRVRSRGSSHPGRPRGLAGGPARCSSFQPRHRVKH